MHAGDGWGNRHHDCGCWRLCVIDRWSTAAHSCMRMDVIGVHSARAHTREVNTEQTMTCSAVCRITCYDVLFHFRCELYSLIDAKEAQNRRPNRWMVRARARQRTHTHTHKHATPTVQQAQTGSGKINIFLLMRISIISFAWLAQIGCSSHCNVLLFGFLFFLFFFFDLCLFFRALVTTHTNRPISEKKNQFPYVAAVYAQLRSYVFHIECA